MAQAIAPVDTVTLLEQVLVTGDLAKLSPGQRLEYYRSVCTSLGLNPLTRPFDYIVLNSKLTLYAKKDCAEQLRRNNGVSIPKPDIQFADGLCIVSVTAVDKHGRSDSDIGAVLVEGVKGEARANAIMKAVTKAKRRVTLSICGLGMLDETEVESIPDAQTVRVDMETGEITEPRRTLPPGKPRPPITSEHDPLWRRWVELAIEAADLGIPVPDLELPVEQEPLIAAGQALAKAITAKKATIPTAVPDEEPQDALPI